jgi:DNA-binding IscR family transcriptional regulator
VARAVDGRQPLDGCILGYSWCSDRNPCPLHDAWGPIREQVEQQLNRRTLLELVPFEMRRQGRGDHSAEPVAVHDPSHT